MLDYEEYSFIGERSKTFDPFIHETKWVFYVEYLSLWSTAVLLCCKPRYIAGYCTVLKNDKISRICPYLMLTMVIQLFSDRKYIFSSSCRQHELRPSEYEHNDTISNESQMTTITTKRQQQKLYQCNC